jgi:murein DD-endopeptidase MepM/ murein hydrolase activator NlpD/muramidase (phage lysozyme)
MFNPRNPNPGPRLSYSFAKVQIGEDVFVSGDRDGLMEARVFLGEGERQSNCSFLVLDPQQYWAQKYFSASYADGGLVGLGPPPSSGTATTTTADAGGIASSVTADDAQVPELRAWLDTIAWGEGTSGPDGYNIMFTGAKFTGYADHPRQLQCSGSLCSDAAGRYQFLSTTWDGLGVSGDFGPINQDKGGVQLIANRGVLNQARSGLAGFDAVLDACSYEWASMPAADGSFRYPGQGQHTPAEMRDYYTKKLAFYKGQPKTGGTPAAPATTNKSDNPAPSTPAIVEEAPPTETGEKGQEITITFGFDQTSAVEFTFIHTATRHQMHLNATEFEGTCVRWALTRRIKNATYSNITLKTLAEQVGRSYGLTVECPENGPTFTHLDQTGITDYALLRRECARIGWRLLDRDGKLIIEPRTVGEEAFLLEYGMNIASFSCEDRAQTDAANGRATATNTGETKAIVDTGTGEIKQLRPENKGAIGSIVSPLAALTVNEAVPGLANTATVAADGKVKVNTPPAPAPQSTTGSATAPVQGTIADDSEVTQEDAAAGSDNAKRVKGFPAKVTAFTSAEMLQVTPDTPVRTEGFLADFLNRVWVVDTIEHAWKGSLKTAIALYTPMKPKFNIAAGSAGAAPAATSTIAPPKGKMTNPHPGAGRGTPFDPSGAIRGRPHMGIDLAKDSNPAPMLAGFAGIVSRAGDLGDGYGGSVEIQGEGDWAGYDIFYGHLSSVSVSKGQKVTAGQTIGVEGNTGASGGLHLHFELRKGGANIDPEPYLSPCPVDVYGEGANVPLRCTN